MLSPHMIMCAEMVYVTALGGRFVRYVVLGESVLDYLGVFLIIEAVPVEVEAVEAQPFDVLGQQFECPLTLVRLVVNDPQLFDLILAHALGDLDRINLIQQAR